MDQMWSTTFDAENRLVASDLERRWNEKLSDVQAIEEELARTLVSSLWSTLWSKRSLLMGRHHA
jgi:hypothetical protein